MKEQMTAGIEQALAGGALEFSFDIEASPDDLLRLGVACSDDARSQVERAAAKKGLQVRRWSVEQDNAQGCCRVTVTLTAKSKGLPGAFEPPADIDKAR